VAGLIAPRPLAASDDRVGFDCGRPSLNEWFTRHAQRNHDSGMSRVSVMCDSASGQIAGYVALSAGQIERAYLAKRDQRNRPDAIPILLLGQLAVDRRHQGKGCAKVLLYFALTTAVRVARDIGCFAVLTHPLDDDVRAFYRRFDFVDTPFDPKRSMIVKLVDLEHAGIGANA
jgi:GNAT superfamily N-acetyltransferase